MQPTTVFGQQDYLKIWSIYIVQHKKVEKVIFYTFKFIIKCISRCNNNNNKLREMSQKTTQTIPNNDRNNSSNNFCNNSYYRRKKTSYSDYKMRLNFSAPARVVESHPKSPTSSLLEKNRNTQIQTRTHRNTLWSS